MKLIKGNGTGEKDLQDNQESICDECRLKKMLLELAEPDLKEIKAKFRKKHDREVEIGCMISSMVSFDIFDRDLDEKEFQIFLDTYLYMLDYAPVINETLSELYSKVNGK